jgi:hypothetical protein
MMNGYDRADIPALGEVLTAKGEALEKFPFTQQEWAVNTETTAWGETLLSWNAFSSWSGNRDNLHNIKLDEIGTIYLENNVVVPNRIFKVKTYSETSGKVSLFYTDTARVDKSIWNGLMEAKGSLLGIAFLSSLFGLKAHSSAELQVVDAERKIFKPIKRELKQIIDRFILILVHETFNSQKISTRHLK